MGTTTTNLGLYKPAVGESGWGALVNANYDRLDQACVNVKAFGAVGDGVTDDTAEIQAAINAAAINPSAGAILFFPAGKYIISSTLVLPDYSVGIFMGSGALHDNPYNAGVARKGSQTTLYWAGAAGGTMISGIGVHGWNFKDFALAGRVPAGTGNRAGIGYHQKYEIGAGGLIGSFDRIGLWDIAVGFQMGEVQADDNCADTSFNSCVWTLCDTCVLIKNGQGVNYRFEQSFVDSCPRFVHCEYGGAINVNLLNTAGCGGTGASDWVFLFDNLTTNVGTVLINNWRAEANTKQFLKAANSGHIVITGLEECSADQNVTQFKVRGPRLTVRNSRLTTCDATNGTFDIGYGGSGQITGLFLEDVHFDVATWVFAEWLKTTTGEDSIVQVSNCNYGTAGIGELQLPNLNTHIQYGPVTHYGQTTAAVQTSLGFNGSATPSYNNTCHIPEGSTWLIDAYVVGQEVGGGADVGAFHRRCVVKNVGGTVSQIGTTQTIGTDFNTDSWGGVDFDADSPQDSIDVIVTGKTSTTINWKALIVGARADTIV